MRIAVVWVYFVSYHVARLQALREAVTDGEVLGIEIGSGESSYSWRRREEGKTGIVTLMPGRMVEDLTAVEIYRSALALLRSQRIEVVFVPSYWPESSMAIIAAARTANVRVVTMNDSHAGTAKARGLAARIKSWIVRQFDAALVAGTPHREYLGSLGLDENRIILGYDAIDNHRFAQLALQARERGAAIREKHGLPPRYFLSVGRMEWKKNLETLVDAYRIARTQLGADCPALLFVGSGRLGQSLVERCRSAGLSVQTTDSATSRAAPSAEVHFLGIRQVHELPEFYALADCFVLPSREEEWGLVVNEAMACGVPVLVSETAGCARDLVRDGENGYRFPPLDPARLAEKLVLLAQQPELRRSMGEASSRIIADWGCERFASGALQAASIAMRAE